MKDRFYLACFRGNFGGNIVWHCKDGNGYSTDISKAHKYTLKEAQEAWERGREFDRPISADHVDELCDARVDMQHIPHETQKMPDDYLGEYVAYQAKKYAGNDVYWFTDTSLNPYYTSLNFDQAQTFKQKDVKSNKDIVFVPRHIACKARREVFLEAAFNPRTMVQGAGLKQPEWYKKLMRKEKRSPGKVRWNCPSCGKINWHYNPYDFEGCSDAFCEEFRY